MNKRYMFRTICPICCDEERVICWRHEGDGGAEWIDIYGNIQCMQCGMKGFITNWRFNCAYHTNNKKYHDPKNSFIEKKKFINAFAMLLTDDAKDEDEKEFLKELIKNIKNWKG